MRTNAQSSNSQWEPCHTGDVLEICKDILGCCKDCGALSALLSGAGS